MPGPATATDLTPTVEGGHAQAIAPGRSVSVLDARPPSLWSVGEEDEALMELERRAGPAAAGIVRRVEEASAALRGELNRTAGGQASGRVMTLAHNAQRAQLAVELQTSISIGAYGRYVANDGDKGQAEKGLHRLVGICAFATDLLNKAHEAAKEEGQATKGGLVGQTFSLIGVGQNLPSQTEAPAAPPFGPPGGVGLGPPSLSTALTPDPSPKDSNE